MKKKSTKPVDKRAVPTIKKPTGTDASKVDVTRTTSTAMQGSPLWQGATGLQGATKVWNSVADDMDKNATAIRALYSQIDVLMSDQQAHRRDWITAKRRVISEAETLAAGSADKLRALGFDIVVRGNQALHASVPTGLSSEPGKKPGEATFTWPRGDARHGFIVQSAADLTNPAAYAPPKPCTKTKYTVKGVQPGAVVHFRVAAIDTSVDAGQSPWSDWVAGTAR